MSGQQVAKTPNRPASAVLCALMIPLALLGGGELLTRTGKSAPVRSHTPHRPALISRQMAAGVSVGEPLSDLLYRLGPPDITDGEPTGPRLALFYHTDDGGAAVVRLRKGRVVRVSVLDRAGEAIRMTFDQTEFSHPPMSAAIGKPKPLRDPNIP